MGHNAGENKRVMACVLRHREDCPHLDSEFVKKRKDKVKKKRETGKKSIESGVSNIMGSENLKI